MPFVTEELWQRLGGEGLLALAEWPAPEGLVDAQARADIDWVIALVTAVRSVRSEMNVPPGAKLPIVLVGANEETRQRAGRYDEPLQRLARLDGVSFGDTSPAGAVQVVVGEATVALPLADVIDLAAERARLEREIGKMDDEIGKISGKLANENFTSRAPEHVVEEQRERKAEAEETRTRLSEALERLKGAA